MGTRGRIWSFLLGLALILTLPLLGHSSRDQAIDIFSISKWYGYFRAIVETGKHSRIEAYQEVEIAGRLPNMPFPYGGALDFGALATKNEFVSWIMAPGAGIPTQYSYEIAELKSANWNVEGDKDRWKSAENWTGEGEEPTIPPNVTITLDAVKKVYSIRLPWQELFSPKLSIFHRYHRQTSLKSDPTIDVQEWMLSGRIAPKGQKGFSPVVLNLPLPGDSMTLAGTQTFEVNEAPSGRPPAVTKITMEWSLSPKKFPKLDLILDADGYDSWRPMGGKNEKDPGNSIRVTAKLETLAPGDVPDECEQIRFWLNGVSHEKGVCINYPPDADPELSFDLQILKNAENASLEVVEPFTAVKNGSALQEAAVTITSFDYGGWGEITARARLKSGRQILGHRRESPDKKLQRIPKSKPGSHIAECWNPPGGDAMDDETDPVGDGQHGDGLTLYEEYRGFYEGGRWKTINPKDNKKKLFVQDETYIGEPAFSYFKVATGIDLHSRLGKKELDDDQVLNFNHTDGAHRTNQHGVLIRWSAKPWSTIRAKAQPSDENPTDRYGSPKYHHLIVVNRTSAPMPIMPADGGLWTGELTMVEPALFHTIIHELCHCCGVEHHGDPLAEADVRHWTVAKDPMGNELLQENGKTIQVVDEDSPNLDMKYSLISEIQALGKGSKDVRVGVWGGSGSGAADCVMRYYDAFTYSVSKDPSVRIKIRKSELTLPWPPTLCDSKKGTGLNDPSHEPEPHFGPATKGACKKQLLVNDALEPIKVAAEPPKR